ncbi:MAG TPA: alpha/beta hydrolase [Polyangiales bacterium]|nr:alpha/beta hydrolase [Polyangiales bacterium]
MKSKQLSSKPRSFRPPALERAEQTVARALFRLPARLQFLLSGRKQVALDGVALDPNMQLMLALTREHGKQRSLSAESVAKARSLVRANALRFAGRAPCVGEVRELEFDGPAGVLRARHYVPAGNGAPQPLVVFFHGGGFALCDLDTHDLPCRELCVRAGVHVLSVEYRLAPEHPYPAAVEDALAAFRFAQAHASELGADPDAIAVAGDSAGGNLSAVVAQRTRHDRPPRLQVLIYPNTDVDRSRPSRTLFGRGFMLTAADIDWFDGHYSGGVPREPGYAPLTAADFSGLCPAVIVTCGFDPLRDEGEAYARALQAAGNRVDFWREAGLVHGFLHMSPVSPSAEQAMARLAAAVRAGLIA